MNNNYQIEKHFEDWEFRGLSVDFTIAYNIAYNHGGNDCYGLPIEQFGYETDWKIIDITAYNQNAESIGELDKDFINEFTEFIKEDIEDYICKESTDEL